MSSTAPPSPMGLWERSNTCKLVSLGITAEKTSNASALSLLDSEDVVL